MKQISISRDEERKVLANVFIDRLNHDSRHSRINLVETWDKSSVSDKWFASAYNAAKIRGDTEAKGSGLNEKVQNKIKAVLKKRIKAMSKQNEKADFDKWHRKTVSSIARCANWKFGRSQKILNVLLKYYFVVNYAFKTDRAISRLGKFFHAPVDRRTVDHVAACCSEAKQQLKPKRNLISWWRDMTPEQYVIIQKVIYCRALKEKKQIAPLHYEMKYIW